MIRVLCTTNHCTLQAAQLAHAQQANATLRGLLDAAQAERDALALQLAQARRERDEAQKAAQFHLEGFTQQHRKGARQ